MSDQKEELHFVAKQIQSPLHITVKIQSLTLTVRSQSEINQTSHYENKKISCCSNYGKGKNYVHELPVFSKILPQVLIIFKFDFVKV